LEELRRKQDEYYRGKKELIENFTRGLIILEREQIQSQRLAELCSKTSEAFRDYLEQLQDFQDEDWSSTTVAHELNKALTVIEHARLEYNRARTKLDCMNPTAPNETEPEAAGPVAKRGAKSLGWDEIFRYACIGAAASAAPVIITVWLVIIIMMR